MTINVSEKPESRSFGRDALNVPDKETLLFTVWNTELEAEADAAAQVFLPAFIDGLRFQGYTLDKQEGPVWDGEAEYARVRPSVPAYPPGGGPGSAGGSVDDFQESSFEEKVSISFDTRGETIHITKSISTVGYPDNAQGPQGPVLVAPDEKGAIGATDQGVEGIDLNTGGLEWTETHSFPPDYVDQAFLNTLTALSWHVNDAPFRGYLPGEVLFKGASGTQKTGDDGEIGFTFYAKANRLQVVVGDMIIPFVKGHDYIDVRYKDDVEEVGKILIKVPQFVYVHKVYPDGDFSSLDIGV